MRLHGRIGILLTVVMLLSASPFNGQSDQAFPIEVYAARRAALLRQIGDAAVVVPGRNLVGQSDLVRQDPGFWYLTGVESPYAVLVLTPGRSVLFLPGPYQFAGAQYPMLDPAFRRATWNRPVRRLSPGPDAVKATGVTETFPLEDLATKLPALLSSFETVYLPHDAGDVYSPPGLAVPLTIPQQTERAIAALLPGKSIRDVSPMLERMRLVKDAHEVAALRRAAGISAEGLVAAMRAVQPGMNDREVAGLMEYVWKRDGSPRASFAPIVASGQDAMTLFTLRGEVYNSVDRTMQTGDLLFIDYGAAEFQMYTADLCRTLPVSGRFTPEQRKYYDIVLEAQQAAIDAIKPGAMMVDVVKASARVFHAHGLDQYEDIARMGEDHVWGIMPSPTHYLTRSAGLTRYSASGIGVRDLGHHIGLEVQESRDYSQPLQPGVVVTIEPKIYIPDSRIAIMIEDMILVTPDGHENLSSAAPKSAADIERIMAEPRQSPALGARR